LFHVIAALDPTNLPLIDGACSVDSSMTTRPDGTIEICRDGVISRRPASLDACEPKLATATSVAGSRGFADGLTSLVRMVLGIRAPLPQSGETVIAALE
jgi:hypothetical protein